MLVTAFGAAPPGSRGTLLRVWEQAGVSGKLTVTFPVAVKFATATPINLRNERAGEPIQLTAGQLSFNLNAYAPASFVLE